MYTRAYKKERKSWEEEDEGVRGKEKEQLEAATVVFVAWAITILGRWTFNALSNQQALIHHPIL